MIFFWGETPDGWGIPGIRGPAAGDGREMTMASLRVMPVIEATKKGRFRRACGINNQDEKKETEK